MTEHQAKRDPNRCPTHPGALLNEVLKSVPMGKGAIADALGISRQHLHDLITEKKPVSAKIAVRLGTLFGNGAELWFLMQAKNDLWHAAREVDTSEIKMIA